MLAEDLADAGIDPVSAEARLNLHALRQTYSTSLARSGVSIEVHRRLMRHESAEMSLRVFSHLGLLDDRRAVAALPDLSTPEPGNVARATGPARVPCALGGAQPGCSASCSATRASGDDTPCGPMTAGTPSGEPQTAMGGSGGGTRTPDTRIMIPLL